MNYFESGITFESKMGDGSAADESFFSSIFNAGKRMLTGESLFMTHFTNSSATRKKVAFAAPYPGKVIALDIAKFGGEFLCQNDSFLCAAKGTSIDIAFSKRLGAGFFGGEGFILQRLKGDGLVFVHAGGTIVEKQLNNETLIIDTGCIVAFSPTLEYDIQMSGGLKSMFFGGEGFFLATIQGTGKVYLQSLPFSRLAERVIEHIPRDYFREKG